ncbi:RNA polymerase [Chrysochromulina tobinii]|uniref:DNA-directed RNA polymerase n=1 Tax=Chrysochromulina tobinii TaxID=1460289 RepID=A0A0M0JJH9_9EUKA|nr:RNA polymerase [Chrysochromulina tobinii]|eukprot:KOO26739.1 RNA polymerase [Chrysochromulina sp. CCMP291]
MDAYIELQSTASASVQTSSTHTRAAPDERGALDVLGNPVVLYYPRCSEAPSLSPWNATTRTSWREMLDVDPPVGLSECEQRQWRQEVLELHSIDIAVAEYRSRYAQVQTRTKLTSSELLDRRSSQREMVSAGWFTKVAAQLHADMLAWASGESPSELRKRSKVPTATFGALLNDSTSGPRDVALDAVRRLIAKPREAGVPHVLEALLAAEERVLALPREAKPQDVRRAIELVGAHGTPAAQTERATLARQIKSARNGKLRSTYEKNLSERLEKLAEHLAAISLNHVTSELLQPSEVEGVQLTRLAIELATMVQSHYQREDLVRYRSEQLREIEGDAPRDRREIEGDASRDRREIEGDAPRDRREIEGDAPRDRRETEGDAPRDRREVEVAGELSLEGEDGPRDGGVAGEDAGEDAHEQRARLIGYKRKQIARDLPEGWDRPEPSSLHEIDEDEDDGRMAGRMARETLDEDAAAAAAQAADGWLGDEDDDLFAPSQQSALARPDMLPAALEGTSPSGSPEAASGANEPHANGMYEPRNDGRNELHTGGENEFGPAAFCVYQKNGASLREKLGGGGGRRKKQYESLTYVCAHPLLYDTLVAGDLRFLRHTLDPEAKPMLTPPLAWSKPGVGEMPRGGQLHIATQFVRTDSVQHAQIIKSTPQEVMQPMLDGLNALSRTEWRVNKRVLSLVEFMWEAYPSGLPFIPDCPSAVEMPPPPSLPPMPPPDASHEQQSAYDKEIDALNARYSEELNVARLRQYNFQSQRISARLKLDVAAEFADTPFYFPHNLDFRGRVYAVGPHLQYLGDDLARGLLQFALAKPLGESGHFWLKVQLANLYGKDKLPLHERAAWTEARIAEGLVRSVDEQPLAEASSTWWMGAENPVQALQCVFELQAVERHLDEGGLARDFHSALPVQQDGSCNGLQHYAALGRDRLGATQVNLVPADRPSDVYSGVTLLVQQQVAASAARPLSREVRCEVSRSEGVSCASAAAAAKELEGLDEAAIAARDAEIEAARLLDGLISRKVVKQTVMTSVYGVTRIGARDQIYNRLKDINDAGGFVRPMSRDELRRLAQYTSKLTFGSMGEVFSGATNAMGWLADVATQIAKDTNQPVVWGTPLGWPVLQPYFNVKGRRVKTPFNMATIYDPDQLDLLDDNSKAPVLKAKQRSALPPNYVHSLDSSHMLMTATRCVNEGLTFAAVHDSFWTHACDVPRMNVLLREAFIELHTATNLKCLHAELMERFPQVRWDRLPPPPEQGDLDITCVRDSTYFFS